MLREINTAVEFIVRLLKSSSATPSQSEAFKTLLRASLARKFTSHWHPAQPMKGNAYRSILVTQGLIDPILTQSANAAGLPALDRRWLPSELIIWIDPLEVTYRIGDSGSVAILPLEPALPFATASETATMMASAPVAILAVSASTNGPRSLAVLSSPSQESLALSMVPRAIVEEHLVSSSTATTDPVPIEVR